MKYLFIALLITVIFSCNNEQQKAQKEIDNIAYRDTLYGITKEEALKLNICKECYTFKDAILLNGQFSKIGTRDYFIELQFRDNLFFQTKFYGATKSFNDMMRDLKHLKEYVVKNYKEPQYTFFEPKEETLSPRVHIYGWLSNTKIIVIDIVRANQWSKVYRAELFIKYLSPEERELSKTRDTFKEEPTKF